MASKTSSQLIGSYQHLPQHPRPQHALFLLRKIASLVKPIMVNRRFRVGTLAEFYPQEHNLLGLNINAGQQILLRLRQPYDPNTFLSEEQILETMLHELCHNVHGPHDEKFYGFLANLEDEHRDLRKKGWSGEGFYSEGKRLGGRPAAGVSMAEVRRRAAEKAEQRRKTAAGSGQRLGGIGRKPESDAARRQRLAVAAERRKSDKEHCGAGRGVEGEGAKADEEGVTTKYDEATEDAELAAALQQIAEMERAEEEAARKMEEVEVTEEGWVCQACTFVNNPLMEMCEMCETPRPQEKDLPPPALPPRAGSNSGIKKLKPTLKPSGRAISAASKAILELPKQEDKVWICHMCTLVNEDLFWTCSGCGTMKLVS